MSDDTIYPAEIYPGGSEAEFAALKKRTLDYMGNEFFDNAKAHGFWEPDGSPLATKKAEKIALMHSELSEALEAVRKPQASQKLPGLSLEVEELADCLIRLLDYCNAYGLPIDEAVRRKHEYNKTRPYKHGKAF